MAIINGTTSTSTGSSGGSSDAFVKTRARFDTAGTFSYTLPSEVTVPVLAYLVGIAGGGGGLRMSSSVATRTRRGGNGKEGFLEIYY